MQVNNQQQSLESGSNSQTWKKIASILNTDPLEIQKAESKNGIDSILKENSQNEKLALFYLEEYGEKYFSLLSKDLQRNKKIITLALSKSYKIYNSLDVSFKKDPQIAQIAIEGMVYSGVGFFVVEELLEQYFGDDKKNFNQLFLYYQGVLKKSELVLFDDFSKNIISLKSHNPALYEIFKKQKLFLKSTQKPKVDPSFIQKLFVEIKAIENYADLPENEKNHFKLQLIIQELGIDGFSSNQTEQFFLNSIIELLNIQIDKDLIKDKSKKLQDQNKQDKKDESNSDKQNQEKNTSDIATDENQDIIFTKNIEYSLPNHQVESYSGGYYVYHGDYKVPITPSESEKFTSKALENYVKFYEILELTGLKFLWEKYRSGFKILAGNNSGFDYTNGDGITQTMLLSVLNMVGKNIGIPQQEVLGEDGETLKETKCFKTIPQAKSAFGHIKETGTINGKQYSDLGTFSNTAVENFLIERSKIDGKGSVSITNWR